MPSFTANISTFYGLIVARGFALSAIGGLLLWAIGLLVWSDRAPLYHTLVALVTW
jgi:hypothetical protein